MKERSVIFYKRLIVFATLSIIIVIACFLTYFIGNKLEMWDIEPIAKETMKEAQHEEDKNAGDTEKSNVSDDSVSMKKESIAKSEKFVYLTFDDGSSENTSQILEVLKENDIKATFFFNTSKNQTPDSIIKEAYDNGHAVGVLTSTDYNYDTIYSSVENYMIDFESSYNRIYQITGDKPNVLRFPGGSINVFNKSNYKELIEAIKDRGMVYFDWNVCANDGVGNVSKEYMIQNATKLPRQYKECIVLMHDNGNDNSCEALKEIIQFYKENGYVFEKLTANVEPITF